MKKAVIVAGSKQYIVAEGDKLLIDRTEEKTLTFEPLLVFDEKTTKIGQPVVKDAKVTAKVTEELVKGDKVTAIRYKAKKRVKKVRGSRAHHSQIEITKIA